MKTIYNRQIIIAYTQQLKLKVIPPSKKNPKILMTDYSQHPARHVVDAYNWLEARNQLIAYANAKFN